MEILQVCLGKTSIQLKIGYKGGKKGQATFLVRVNFPGAHLQSSSELGKVIGQMQRTCPKSVEVDSSAILRASVACAVHGHLTQSPMVLLWSEHSKNITEPTTIEKM